MHWASRPGTMQLFRPQICSGAQTESPDPTAAESEPGDPRTPVGFPSWICGGRRAILIAIGPKILGKVLW